MTAPDRDRSRLAAATVILICLSSAPYMSITRWLTDVGLAHTAWPYVYTYWGSAVVGSLFFAHDVVSYRHAIARSRSALVVVSAAAALAVWVLASALWTESPTTSPAESVLAVMVIATAIWFGFALPWRLQVQSLFIAMHVLTVGSVFAVMLVPSARSSAFIGDKSWIGLFGNPNSLGPVATFGVLTALGMTTILDRRRWKYLAILALNDLIVAVGATSITAWFAGGAAAACIALVGGLGRVRLRSREKPGVRWIIILVSIGSVAVLLMRAESVTRLVGKDRTLTGRTVIWRFVFDSLQSRWLVGFGFGSFWDDPARRAEYMARSGRGWVLSSHSSFVDTLLYMGAIGLALLLVLTAAGLVVVARRVLHVPDMRRAWWTGVLVFAVVENLAESMMVMHSIFWLLLVAPGLAVTDGSGRDHPGPRSTFGPVHDSASDVSSQVHRRR